MRYFITLQYDGKNYHGWQIQPNAITVEETVEKALATIFRQSIDIVGAGRTDTGVHASMMVCHFDTPHPIEDCGQLTYKLNKILPNDVCINKIEHVDDDMHARFSAKKRTYHYHIHVRKDAFLKDYSYYLSYPLDFGKMNEACNILIEQTDFRAFCKAGSDTKTTECTIYEAKWEKTHENSFTFIITANRFLRNMVRAIVGTLIEVGRGKITPSEFQYIIQNGSRNDAGDSVPAHALFLTNIEY